jgi:hypothetical protein
LSDVCGQSLASAAQAQAAGEDLHVPSLVGDRHREQLLHLTEGRMQVPEEPGRHQEPVVLDQMGHVLRDCIPHLLAAWASTQPRTSTGRARRAAFLI